MSASNGIVDLYCERIVDITPGGRYHAGMELELEVRMTKAQMRAAVEAILQHVSETEWAAWVDDLSPGVIADAVRAAKEHASA